MTDPWLVHKDTIKELYLIQRHTVNEVMKHMASKYNFRYSKKQYERKIREWGIGKNSKASSWKALGGIIKKRQLQDKDSDVFSNGVRISQKKICRKISEYYRLTAMEKYGKAPSPRTPEGFCVTTPPQSDKATYSLHKLPWFQFVSHIGKHDPFGQDLAATAHGLPATSISKAVALSSSTFHMFNEITRAFSTCILNAKGITPPKMFYLVNVDTRSQCLMSGRETRDEHTLLRRYLPEVELAPICGSAKPTLNTNIVMQYFGVLIYLLSNNLMEAEERNNMVRLLRDHKQLWDHFRHLLSHKHPTSFAVAENLFLDAVTYGNLELVELLLEAGADPKSSLPYVGSALSQAIRCNNIALVQRLLKYGADVNARGHRNERLSPFQVALFDRAHMEIVSILVQAGAYINDEALQIAIWGDYFAATIFLLFYGADVDTLSTSSKAALLCLAVRNGAADLVASALLHGADANHYIDYSEQAHYAFKFGGRKYQGIFALLDRWDEMMPYSWRSSPQTAFQFAINCADIKIIQLLIQHGADINQQHIRPYKHTALDLALKRGDVDIITLIKQFSAHIGSVSINTAPLDAIDAVPIKPPPFNTINAHAHSEAALGAALVAAIRKADVQLITSLLESGADINAQFGYWPRTTALSLAIQTANAALVTFLLDNGVDVLHQGPVALVNAVRIGDLKLIELLLSRGVDFDRDGALKEAAGSRRIECLKLLLGHGADMGVVLSERHISSLFLATLGQASKSIDQSI